MAPVGACTERELFDDVDLCTPRGRLAPAAVGWARRPLHRCALPGTWGRNKRWDFWGVIGPGFALSLTYADVDYLGLADVWFHDFSTARTFARSRMVPLARAMSLPDRPFGAPIRFARRGLELSFVEIDGGTRLTATYQNGTTRFEADVVVERPSGHDSLSVVIPWSERRFQCTTKDVARPATGDVRWNGSRWSLAAGSSWGCLDFGRGKWPWRTKWNWGAAAANVAGHRVGLQLGGKWTVGTGMTENALSVDGRLSKISEELEWTYDPRDWLRPWTIRAPRTKRVALRFTPTYDKVSRIEAGVVSAKVDQCFGTYEGTIVPDDGHEIRIAGMFGWAEEATWRW